MNKLILLTIPLIALIFLSGCLNPIEEKQEEKDDVGINTSSPDYDLKIVDPEMIQYITFNGDRVEIHGCQEVTCECAKNTRTPCMAYCFICEEDWGV